MKMKQKMKKKTRINKEESNKVIGIDNRFLVNIL